MSMPSEIKDREYTKFVEDGSGNTAVRTITTVEVDVATAVTTYNITLTNANTEYSQALSANTKGFRFRCRTPYDVRYAFVTGKVATPTAPYGTLPRGMDYVANEVNLSSKTLYLASSQAGVIVEVDEWS
jgi:hypothetical protein